MPGELSDAEKSRASELIQKKYAHPDWTERIWRKTALRFEDALPFEFVVQRIQKKMQCPIFLRIKKNHLVIA